MPDYLPVIRTFLENFQTDEALKIYRNYVNVYTPHEEDIHAINEKNYKIADLQYAPSVYGGEKVFDLKVGRTSFRIWGKAVEYIKSQAGAL